MIFRYTFLFIVSLFFQNTVLAQEIPIGTWRDHLPYSDGVSVTKNGSLVYCAINSAIFIYNEEDNSIERLNPINGLSDIGISKIKFVPANNRIVIGYKNGNVDVILEDNSIYNLSFLKNSTAIGNKNINHIEIVNEHAYLSTGVGIVVLNTNKLEFSNTYNYNSSGNTNTNAVAFDNTKIYAASDEGVFYADKNSLNLSDFNAWNKIIALGNSKYNGIVFFKDHLFVSYDDPIWLSDSLLRENAGVWEKFPSSATGKNITGISISNDKLLETANKRLYIYDTSLTLIDSLWHSNGNYDLDVAEGISTTDGYYWLADKSRGLIKTKNNWDSESFVPNSPSNFSAFNMSLADNKLWTVAGGYGTGYSKNIINHQDDNWWHKLPSTFQNSSGNNVKNLVSVIINPNNPNNVYAGSWADGLLEFNNRKLTHIYNASNSALDSLNNLTVTGPLAFDEDNNLWITNSFTINILAVKTPNNDWYSYSFPGFTNTLDEFHDMLIDDNNYKWIANVFDRNIIVFDDNGTLNNTNDDSKKLLTPSNSEIPGAKLLAITLDLDGEIWIGTDEGIAVFYNPSEVFERDIKAERIYIQQDGQTQILLETEIITAIAIDGANRKWIGTQTSGVFLMSEDGTEEVEHFTTENSPLFSNNILDIVINNKTGEIYFGTDKGLLSYKGTATEADDDFNNVFVYPNPVREDYTGKIAIRGLVENTDVRITDISGNIVYQTTSLGGQAIWDGNDMHGNRVQTGVYLLFNGSQDGEKKHAAKILFIH